MEKTLTENKTLLSGHSSTATEKPLKCETSIEDALAEIREQDRKKNNFILFNIPESKSLNGVVRSEDDKNKFISITQSLNVKNNDADISFIRLGKPTAEKMRPLVIKGSSVLKSEMFQKIKNLKDLPVDHEHKKIVLRHDLTKKQLGAERILVKEMKRRRENGETVFIRNGVIISRAVRDDSAQH